MKTVTSGHAIVRVSGVTIYADKIRMVRKPSLKSSQEVGDVCFMGAIRDGLQSRRVERVMPRISKIKCDACGIEKVENLPVELWYGVSTDGNLRAMVLSGGNDGR